MDCTMSSYYEKILATGEVKCIDEEVPFEIPKGWEWCRLVEVGKTETGQHHPNLIQNTLVIIFHF